MSNNRDFGRDLYPFLYDDASSPAPSVDTLLEEVRRSTLEKSREVAALRGRIVAEYRDQLVEAALAMASEFRAGGKLLAFGNGGSATDAQDAAADCLTPSAPTWRPLPAIALVDDVATLTAVGNDVGFEHVFSRQIIAFGTAGDIALGISTSGNSANVNRALAEAKRRGLLTIGLSGGDGGAMAKSADVDFCFVSRIEHIPRIQEGHATIWHTLLELTQEALA
jgi:D-sedoheptulose 7-phosphate isomerase